jgi:O-antigen/teichoic acid export membrane protein
MQLRDIGYRLLSISYELIFKEKMSYEAQKFFTGTSYVAIGTLFGALLTFIFYALAARILGPTGFGYVALVTSLGLILSIPIALIIMPMIKYASETGDKTVRSIILSTSYIQATIFLITSVAFYVFFSSYLSQLFGVSMVLFLYAIVYTVAAVPFTLTTNTLRIIPKMRVFALCTAFQSVLVLTVFLVYVSIYEKSWQVAISSILIANVVIGLTLLLYLRGHIKLKFDMFWSKKITHYALIFAPGSVAGAFMGIDRILINKFLTATDVGNYNAYFLTSMTLASLFWYIFNTGFFPYASRSKDRYAILLRINKALPYVVLVFVPLVFLAQAVLFIFYGSQYTFTFTTSFLFTLASAAYVIYVCYSYLMSSEGIRGAKVNSFSSIIALVVLIGLDIVLIPIIGVTGAAAALIFAYSVPAIYLFSKRDLLHANSSAKSP